jgi:hypothetical protein
MRTRRNFMSRIKRLKGEEKVMLVGAIVTIVSCFMPWYGISSRVINEWWNGFGSIGSVAGYLIAFFALSVATLTVLPALDVKPKLPWKSEKITLFLSAQAMFLGLVFLVVYAQYSLYDSPNSSTRFGLYLTLVSSIIMFIASTVVHKNAERGHLSFSSPELVKVPRHHKTLDEERFQRVQEEKLHQQEMQRLEKEGEQLRIQKEKIQLPQQELLDEREDVELVKEDEVEENTVEEMLEEAEVEMEVQHEDIEQEEDLQIEQEPRSIKGIIAPTDEHGKKEDPFIKKTEPTQKKEDNDSHSFSF